MSTPSRDAVKSRIRLLQVCQDANLRHMHDALSSWADDIDNKGKKMLYEDALAKCKHTEGEIDNLMSSIGLY